MFPIILNGVDEDDEDLLLEANTLGEYSTINENSPLFQDNLTCNFGRRPRLLRRFSSDQSTRPRSRSFINQSIIPGERIIEIKSDDEDEDKDNVAIATSSTGLTDERTNLLNNDYNFQRIRPIRIQEYDLRTDDQHSQARMRRNYQVLKSKKRLTFPICFFVGLYISFLFLSSFVFTLFEQKFADTDQFFEIQKRLMLSLKPEQFKEIEHLIEHSVQIQKSGLDVIKVLEENKKNIHQKLMTDSFSTKSFSFDSSDSSLKSFKSSTNDPNSQISNKLVNNQFLSTLTQLPSDDELNDDSMIIENMNQIANKKLKNIESIDEMPLLETDQSLNRRIYKWDFQQALFYVVSIATTIGYGNLIPESDYGKIYTIIFGMISIPYTTILISIIVSKFSNGPLRRFKLSLLTKHFKEKSHDTLRIIRFICLIMATLFISVFIMGLPAILFGKMENWAYLNGFYFIFISITTTGLGDFVPEFKSDIIHWVYEIGVIIFLYFGIILIMLWLTLIKSVFRKSISIKLDEYDRDEEDRHETILEEQVLINCRYENKNYVNYGSFYGIDEVSVRVPR